MVLHLQFPQSVNCQKGFECEIPSSELGTCKQTVEAKQPDSLEESLQALTFSEREDANVSCTDMQPLITQKKVLQSEIAVVKRGIDNLKVT
jgi:hypothetical protein